MGNCKIDILNSKHHLSEKAENCAEWYPLWWALLTCLNCHISDLAPAWTFTISNHANLTSSSVYFDQREFRGANHEMNSSTIEFCSLMKLGRIRTKGFRRGRRHRWSAGQFCCPYLSPATDRSFWIGFKCGNLIIYWNNCENETVGYGSTDGQRDNLRCWSVDFLL
jgi:hypothetical protein